MVGVSLFGALLLASLLNSSNAMVTKRQATYSYLGCRTDSVQNRVLNGKSTAYDTMTVQSCQADCAGFTYAGVEYGRECWCGNTLSAASTVAAESDCSFPCPGNNAQKCGAGDRLSLYILGGGTGGSTTRSTSAATTSRVSTVSTTRVATTTTTRATTTTAIQQPSGFPSGWASAGCWVDGAQGRILADRRPDNPQLTLQSCVSACNALGYSIAGAEYGVECYCGNAIDNGGAQATSEAQCSMNCGGNPNQKCGAGGRLSMYSKGPIESRGAQKTNLPAGWTYQGCIQDNVPNVPAADGGNYNIYTFPYKVWSKQTNDATSCITRCQEYGFSAAGLEYGIECFCGDPRDIQTSNTPTTITNPKIPNFRTRSAAPVTYPDAQCDISCPGNPKYQCGAGNKLTWYAYTGTTARPFLSRWNYPTGASAGTYSLLIGGLTVPLITGQGINGKVAFVEKGGTGLGNGTGAYELDLSQINNFNAAWRTQSKYATDVFCAAGLTLPDRKGRMVTVGGWAGQDLLGIRLWTPDGSAGVKGTSQWQEDVANIQLKRPRWYPSAMIMANGSLLVIGGEIENNGAAEPTVELFPPTGPPVYLDFLQRTWPDNLYPFIAVVPSGIFIAYFNEARILDARTFATIKTLPNMPGSVADASSGRTYSLEGSMVLLPQYAPYTTPLGVLICGGSTSGNPAGLAIDNCISTQPEAANPTWLVERMPSRRVLPCMAGLPDGTYLIVNGGQQGVAGFGLASAPNLNAVLYDPTKPAHNRMSVMANTTVARMYHSEAIALLDGRVMISGSDPTGDPNPNLETMYPNEFRVEVFTPPYLLSGLPRPTFTITNKDWSYGQSVSFTIGGSTTNIRVSLLGSVVSTHGNAMGQRTVFPAVSCNGVACTVTSPPNAGIVPPGWYMIFVLSGPTPSVGQFVRIGGDPAALGNWPPTDRFLPRPGMGAV